MKITFITNACAIYEYQGVRLLSDPWLSESAFEGAWIHDPPIKTKPQDVLDVDALYISHLHQDHADPETLKYFRRDIPIITLKDQFSLCERELKKMGFSNITALKDKETVQWGPFRLTIFAPFAKHPFHSSDIGNVVDSALLITTDEKSVLNTNDNSMTVETAKAFRKDYGQVDIAQLNYNNASEYPCCFINLSREEKIAESNRCIARNLAHVADVAKALECKRVMPFAGAFKLSEKWDHMNEYLGTTSDTHAVSYLKEHGVEAITLKEGESIDV